MAFVNLANWQGTIKDAAGVTAWWNLGILEHGNVEVPYRSVPSWMQKENRPVLLAEQGGFPEFRNGNFET